MAKGLPNLPSDALASYTFSIEIDRTEIAQFSEVSGLASEVDVIELKENTIDGKLVIKKAPGAIKPATITLKRAKIASTELWKWHEAVMQGKSAMPGGTARSCSRASTARRSLAGTSRTPGCPRSRPAISRPGRTRS